MRGPYRKRRIDSPPRFGRFKPAGVPRRLLERAELSLDEYEAIRLADYEGLEHLEASERMNISRPTFTRLIEKARRNLAEAIVDGKEIVIDGGHVDFVDTLHRCKNCDEVTRKPVDVDQDSCPDCGSVNLENLAQRFRRTGRGRRRQQ